MKNNLQRISLSPVWSLPWESLSQSVATTPLLRNSAFSQLKKVKGKVFYSRKNLQAVPPEESMKVMDLIVRYELPVKFYMDKSFTKTADVIGMH